MDLLDELLAGVYKDQPSHIRDDLRALANDRLIEEDLRRHRANQVLAGKCLNDILIEERIASRLNGNGTKPSEDVGYLDKLRRAALTTEQLKAIPKPPWILEDILQADSLAEIYGKPGTYKSFIAAAWTQHVATGVPWSNRTVTPSPVVYIIAEGAHGMGDRITAWETHHHQRITDHHPVIWLPLAVGLGNPAWGQAVGEYAAENGAGLVVFDTRARNTVGLEENSARDMGLVVANLDEARHICRACLLLVHHSNAFGDKSRGSTAVEGAVDTELSVKEADGIVTLKLEKQKNAPDGTEWKFRPQPIADSVILDEISSGPADEISPNGWTMLTTLRDIYVGDPISFTRWVEAGEVAKTTFNRQLKILIERGFVAKSGKAYSPLEGVDARGTNEPF